MVPPGLPSRKRTDPPIGPKGELMRFRGVSSPIVAGGPMLVGAAAAITGAFLEWFEITQEDVSLSVKGIDSKFEGVGVLIYGALIAAFAIAMLARARKKGGRAWSITALVFATIVFILGAFAALAPEEALPSFLSREVSESLNISEQSATAAIVHAIETGRVNARSGIGAYLAFAGGALAAAGAIIGILLARRFRRVPELAELASSGPVTLIGDDLPPPPMPRGD